MISDIKRKTLPAIARVAGLDNEPGLLHFLTASSIGKSFEVSQIKPNSKSASWARNQLNY
jgi:SRSO17 transposase